MERTWVVFDNTGAKPVDWVCFAPRTSHKGADPMYRGYSEQALVTNRSSLFLFGGSESERRAWAEEAAANFEGEGPLTVASSGAELAQALRQTRGVVYVPDVTALSDDAQAQAVHVLREREERPKIVFGAPGDPAPLVEEGRLRDDLHYSLAMAQVNLDEPGVREAIRARRARAPRRVVPPPPAQAVARRKPALATRPKKRSHTVEKDRGARAKKAPARKSSARRRR